ncbi:hypothetical protein CERSUDRAFT_116512 [Gelatoporia subvermispora B]|uniref:Uncharacterized protein n=1 Tax=Ceriporiopsis subvermispora (strain B) TaxID=914234 RepID=M2R992_CERS8|nr:hypothetical protein CERSUDRAFT_116512 [Gelatoporia subvermispora B]
MVPPLATKAIVDSHLSENGEALRHALLGEAATPPLVILHMQGMSRSGLAAQLNIDFDFYIDIRSELVHGPVQWSAPDDIAAFRGEVHKEVGVGTSRRRAAEHDHWIASSWKTQQNMRGFPPWVPVVKSPGANVLSPVQNAEMSAWTIARWVDDYCRSDKKAKEFVFEKKVYGWNIEGLRSAITAIIRSVYKGRVTVELVPAETTVIFRPDNFLSRAASDTAIRALLMLSLTYPIVMSYRERQRGTWAVCGSAYALKYWMPVDSPSNSQIKISRKAATDGEEIASDGSFRCIGTGEDEWLRRWDATIKRAVKERLQSLEPITQPDGGPSLLG